MKYLFSFSLILLTISKGLSQVGNPILISLYQSKVPEGKVWKIEKDKPLLVEFDYFDKYSMCGAAIQSNPGVILIRSGIDQPFKVHEVYFKNLKKSAFVNNLTYSITPIEDVYFYPGTYLIVGTCLRNIQVMEYNLSKAESDKALEEESIRRNEEALREQAREQAEINARQKKLKLFLAERSNTVYELRNIDTDNYKWISSRINQLTKEKYIIDSNYTSFESSYNLKFKSDTLGHQSMTLEKISGKDLDQNLIERLQSIEIVSQKINGYYVTTKENFPINIEFNTGELKVRIGQNGLNYLDNSKPSDKLQELIKSELRLKTGGTYTVKFSELNLLGDQYAKIHKIHRKGNWLIKTLGVLAIASFIILKG